MRNYIIISPVRRVCPRLPGRDHHRPQSSPSAAGMPARTTAMKSSVQTRPVNRSGYAGMPAGLSLDRYQINYLQFEFLGS